MSALTKSTRPATSRRAGRVRGFTLIELLVACALMAVLALLSWRGLDSILQTRERLVVASDELRSLTLAFWEQGDAKACLEQRDARNPNRLRRLLIEPAHYPLLGLFTHERRDNVRVENDHLPSFAGRV